MGCAKLSRPPPPPPIKHSPPAAAAPLVPPSVEEEKCNDSFLPLPPPLRPTSIQSTTSKLLPASSDVERANSASKLFVAGTGIAGAIGRSTARRKRRDSLVEASEDSQAVVIQTVLGDSEKRILSIAQIMDQLLKREEQQRSDPVMAVMYPQGTEKRVLRPWSSFLMLPHHHDNNNIATMPVSPDSDLVTVREMLSFTPPVTATAVHTRSVLRFFDDENETDDDDDMLLQDFIAQRNPTDHTWNVASLRQFLYSEQNSAKNKAKLKQLHDFTRPLTEYFISTSHNTYLFGGQWVYYGGRVDVQMYSNAVKQNCRCVEIDLYDGDNGEPMVTHSNPSFAGGQCSFLEVCTLLADEAFSAEQQMPLLLNLENNMKTNTKRAAEILILAFGERLVCCDDDEFGWAKGEKKRFHASPEAMMGRVLCRSKIRESHADFQRLIYYRNAHLPAKPSTAQFYQTASFSEGKARKTFKKIDDLVEVNRQLLCRVYPRSSAVLSQNYNPLPFWLLGFQLVALNFQTSGPEMDLNQCMFSQSNSCGFVLKPYLFRRKRNTEAKKRMMQLSRLNSQSILTVTQEENDNDNSLCAKSPSFMRVMEDGLEADDNDEQQDPDSAGGGAGPGGFRLKVMSSSSPPIPEHNAAPKLMRDESTSQLVDWSIAQPTTVGDKRRLSVDAPEFPPSFRPASLRTTTPADTETSSPRSARILTRVVSFTRHHDDQLLPHRAPSNGSSSNGGTSRPTSTRNRRSSAGAIVLEGMLAVITGEARRSVAEPENINPENELTGEWEDVDDDLQSQHTPPPPEEITSLSYCSLTFKHMRCASHDNVIVGDDGDYELELVVDGQHALDRSESRVQCRDGEALTAVFKDSISALLTLRLWRVAESNDSSSAALGTVVATRSFFAHCCKPGGTQELLLVGVDLITKFQQMYVLKLEVKTSVTAPLFPSPPPPLYCPSMLSMILCTVVSCRSELPTTHINLSLLDPFVSVQIVGVPVDCCEVRTPPASHCKRGDANEVGFVYPLVLPLAWSEMAFVRFSLQSTSSVGFELDGLVPGGRKKHQQRNFAKRLFGGASPPTSNGGGGLTLPTPIAVAAAAADTATNEAIGKQVLFADAIRSGYRSVPLMYEKTNLHVATLLCHFALFNSKDETFRRAES